MTRDAAQAKEGRLIPLMVPELAGNEWQYLRECLDTNWVSTAGPFVPRFEQATASYLGAGHAVATINGTAALHIALLVAGVRPDDEVLVSSLTFIASANAVRYVGAWPVFVDSEPAYFQMDPQKVFDFLRKECQWRNRALRNRSTGRRVKAILPTDLVGHPVDMDGLLEAATNYNLTVIEDAAQALGAEYKARKVGRLGHVACLSFNGNKIVTAGGGGMVVTDNKTWAKHAAYLTSQARDTPTEYIHGDIGYNYRLSNLHAALGLAQMEKLDEYVAVKRQIAAKYTAELDSLPGVTVPVEASWAVSTFWLYTILLDETACGLNAGTMVDGLERMNVQARRLWMPVHMQKPYHGFQTYRVETAPRVYEEGLTLPCSVGLNHEDQQMVVDSVRKLISDASG